MAKFEQVELEVVEVTEDEKALKVELAPDDYSELFTLTLYKQKYDKDSEKWSSDDETTERFNKQLAEIDGYTDEDAKLTVFIDTEETKNYTGKAFLSEPKQFTRPEKPSSKQAGKLWMNTTITEVRDSPKSREVIVMYNNVLYSFGFNTGMWIEKKKQYILNKAKLEKAIERFNEVFADVVEDAWNNLDKLNGLYITVKVNKNALDPSSEFGWLEPISPDGAAYNDEYLATLKDEPASDDDLPF